MAIRIKKPTKVFRAKVKVEPPKAPAEAPVEPVKPSRKKAVDTEE